MLSTIRQDLVFALRQLRRSPGFALAAIATLAIGIGSATAIFTLIDGILLRPLPFPHPDRLLAIATLQFPPGVASANPAAADTLATSYPDYFDWRRNNHTFESLASYDYIYRLFSNKNGENARVIGGGRVSANLFSTLGVHLALGRDFVAEEELPGHRVAILSHELWASDFASSPNVIGEMVKISDEPYTVIGVMPAGFHFPIGEPALFWTTYSIDAEGPFNGTTRRDNDRLGIVGRLKEGVMPSAGLADLNSIQRSLAQQYSEDRYKLAVSVQPLLEEAVSDIRSPLSFLFVSVAVLLLIGCANVAGLLLARASRRRPELALRTALGASRGRVIRQLLVEAILLAVAGGAVGIVLSIILLRASPFFVPAKFPRFYNTALNGQVLAFAVLLSAATAVVFGLLPALRMSQQDPAHALRECSPNMTSGRRRNRLHQTLVVAQTALGFTLLIGSGLLIRSFLYVLHIEPGFEMKHRVLFDIALTNKRYPVPAKVLFLDKVLPELAALPGVQKISAAHPLPILWGAGPLTNFTIASHPTSPDNLPAAGSGVAMPGYFETLSIPLLRGRTFTAHDNDPKSPLVAIVNQAFVERYFRGEDPIGQYFTPTFEYTTEPLLPRQIVGIVGNTRTEDAWQPYQPQFFLPYAQNPSHQRAVVVMNVSGDPMSYQETIRKLVARLDPDAPVFSYRTFADGIAEQASQFRFEAVLVSAFSAIALLLSALGLYGVLSYVVAERTRELGLRMAFGASRTDILRLVLNRALILSALGVVLGVTTSLFTTKLVTDLLINVKPLDPSTFAVVTLTLLLVSIASALAPALRAAWLDPMRTLHEQ